MRQLLHGYSKQYFNPYSVWLHLFVLLLFIFSYATGISHAAENDLDAGAIDYFVNRQIQLSRLPVVSLVIVNQDGELYTAAYSLDETEVSADTPFLLGSVSKTFTALAVAQLVDMGKINFDDPVTEYLSDFSLRNGYDGQSITIRHLLTHTSGFKQWSGHDRRAQQEGYFNHISLANPPGTVFEYSSLNYIILGKVIEEVSEMSYSDYVQYHIFEPLNMQNSFIELDTAYENGLVDSYNFLYGFTIKRKEHQQPEPLIPAGFIVSSARDIGNFLSMHLNNGQFNGQQIISSETLQEMLSPWDGGESGAGMAWGIGSITIGHAGTTPTFSARVQLIPEEKLGIALLANVNSGPLFPGNAAVLNGISQIVQGNTVKPSLPYEIIFKIVLLILMLVSIIRLIFRFQKWNKQGLPHRLIISRRILMPILIEVIAAVVVLYLIPRWIGVPLFTLLEYFPDIGIAMIVSAFTGLLGALISSFVTTNELIE